MNNTATRMIRSEEITIDMRICTILAGGKKPGEVYFAAIAPDMELTVITLDEAPKDGGQALPDWPGHSGTHQHGRELHFAYH